MDGLNMFFQNLAGQIGLPDFFKSNTLFFNNLFLAAVAAVSLLIVLLVAFLVPGKNRKAKSYYRAAERR